MTLKRKFILLLVLAAISLIYNFKSIVSSEDLEQVAAKNPNSSIIKAVTSFGLKYTIKTSNGFKHSDSDDGYDHGHQHGHGQSNGADAANDGASGDDLVYYKGKAYKKSPDNTYIIDGQKVFIQSAKKAQPPVSPAK